MGENIRLMKFKRGVIVNKIPLNSAQGDYLSMNFAEDQFNMRGESKLIINRNSQQLKFVVNLY